VFLKRTGNSTRAIREVDVALDEGLQLVGPEVAHLPLVPVNAKDSKATYVDAPPSFQTVVPQSPSQQSNRMTTITRTSSFPKVTLGYDQPDS
jgi:hypothetical protein